MRPITRFVTSLIAAAILAAPAFAAEPDWNRIAQALRTRVRSEFSVNTMVEGNLAAYREAIASQQAAQLA